MAGKFLRVSDRFPSSEFDSPGFGPGSGTRRKPVYKSLVMYFKLKKIMIFGPGVPPQERQLCGIIILLEKNNNFFDDQLF